MPPKIKKQKISTNEGGEGWRGGGGVTTILPAHFTYASKAAWRYPANSLIQLLRIKLSNYANSLIQSLRIKLSNYANSLIQSLRIKLSNYANSLIQSLRIKLSNYANSLIQSLRIKLSNYANSLIQSLRIKLTMRITLSNSARLYSPRMPAHPGSCMMTSGVISGARLTLPQLAADEGCVAVPAAGPQRNCALCGRPHSPAHWRPAAGLAWCSGC